MIRNKFQFDTVTPSSIPKTSSSPLKRRHSSEPVVDKLATKINTDTGVLPVDNEPFICHRYGMIPQECEKMYTSINFEQLQNLNQIYDEPLDVEKQKNEARHENVRHAMINEEFNSLDDFETSLNLSDNSNISSQPPEVGCKNTQLIINIAGDDSRTVPSRVTKTIVKHGEEVKAKRINRIRDVKKRLVTISTKITSQGYSSRQLISLLKAEQKKLENICSEMKTDYKDAVERQLIRKVDISKGPCDSLDKLLRLEENLNDKANMSELIKILISEFPINEIPMKEALKIVKKRIMIQEMADFIRELNNETFISELKNIRQAVLGAMKIRFLLTNSSAVIKLWNENLLSN